MNISQLPEVLLIRQYVYKYLSALWMYYLYAQFPFREVLWKVYLIVLHFFLVMPFFLQNVIAWSAGFFHSVNLHHLL